MSKILFAMFLSPAARFARYLFVGRAMLFTTVELTKPARDVNYRSVAIMDLLAWAGYSYLIVPMASYLDLLFPGRHLHLFPASILALPLPVRIALGFVLADFGEYWVHRLMHTRYFWAAHKWHHAPTYMYWLAGVRASLPQQFLFNIPNVLVIPLFLTGTPRWLALSIGVFGAMLNDWMHMNVTWRSRRLEWLIVTPRYHHLHHSDDPRHYAANMGSMFTVWDRLFGTYIDPETVQSELTFGIGERENPVRLVLGV
jgi:sterol desaturase/sphingolipid hydroxylase (fatty acid hydroxylase superfamily)